MRRGVRFAILKLCLCLLPVFGMAQRPDHNDTDPYTTALFHLEDARAAWSKGDDHLLRAAEAVREARALFLENVRTDPGDIYTHSLEKGFALNRFLDLMGKGSDGLASFQDETARMAEEAFAKALEVKPEARAALIGQLETALFSYRLSPKDKEEETLTKARQRLDKAFERDLGATYFFLENGGRSWELNLKELIAFGSPASRALIRAIPDHGQIGWAKDGDYFFSPSGAHALPHNPEVCADLGLRLLVRADWADRKSARPLLEDALSLLEKAYGQKENSVRIRTLAIRGLRQMAAVTDDPDESAALRREAEALEQQENPFRP